MRIALENLLRNAWKFTGDEPVVRISFYAIRESDNVMFCVADNGIGFDMAYADKLFMPFYRLHASSDFAGSGIGLATVRAHHPAPRWQHRCRLRAGRRCPLLLQHRALSGGSFAVQFIMQTFARTKIRSVSE